MNEDDDQQNIKANSPPIAQRFRGYLPVIIDIETGGLNPTRDAILEIAAVTLRINDEGVWESNETHACHVIPFEGAGLNPKSLEINKIDPFHPLRFAVSEKEALKEIFQPIRQALKKTGCQRAVLVGHNAWFDLHFLNAAVNRTQCKRNPFHPFTCFDTATLGGVLYGQTVLARIMEAAELAFDRNEAHSAIYDAEKTAELFCHIVNKLGVKY